MRPGVRHETCLRVAPAAVAPVSAVLNGGSHTGVVLRMRYLPDEKVARNGHQRGKSYGRRHGKNTDGPVDRRAAGRRGKKHGDTDTRITRHDA
jgi:hypothetical protein